MGTRAMAVITLLGLALAGCGGDSPGGPVDGAAASADARVQPVSRVEGYIRSDEFTSLVLEIDSVPGSEPRMGSETALASGLAQILDKPGGVSVTRDDTLVSQGSDHAWTPQELFALADETFNLAVDASTTRMHVLFVDGHYSGDGPDGTILGIAWANTHLVMFKQSIETVCAGPLVPALLRERVCAATELTVWTHEVGHLLGLVNTGLPMQTDHQDTEHGAHDINDDCVMYYAYDGSAVVTRIVDRITAGGNDALGFDQACVDDIAAVRDR